MCVAAIMDHSGIVKSAKELGVGVAGLVLITFAAVRLGLQPGAVSLPAVLLCSAMLATGVENPSRYRGKPCFSGHRVGDLRHGLPRPKNDGGSGDAEIRGAPG